MSGVDWLVFSRDRACQLDALLRSLELRAATHTRTVTVLYEATSPTFGEGYRMTRSAWPWAWHVPEIDFAEQVRSWLEQATDVVGFLCDDDVFYRETPALLELPLPFSFRLGLNCTRQHPTGLENVPAPPDAGHSPELATQAELFSWDWRGAAGDWGYPFSLDGHVYPRELVRELLAAVTFSDPTTLEAGVVSLIVDAGNPSRPAPPAAHGFSTRYYAGARSSLVSIPANRVTVNAHNPIASNGVDVATLNEWFLRYRRVDLERMDFSSVDAAHSEVRLVLSL